MARLMLCDEITGTGTFVGSGFGEIKMLQIVSTGNFSATLSASTLKNNAMTPILTATTNDFYVFNGLTDANYQLVITSNTGKLSAALS